MQPQYSDDAIGLDSAGPAALYDQYGKIIFAYVRLHTSSREDAEDLTLDVFTAALEHGNFSTLRPEERLAWLRRVAHNRLVDSYRRRTRHPVVMLDEVVESLLEDESAAPEQQALRHESYAQLYRAIAQLPAIQQQILQLRYGDELRHSEIAVLLNKSEEAVRKLLSRTLASLRTLYSHVIQEGGRTC